MAQYQHLPIYKTTYELLQVVTRATAGFSKAYKYSLGDKLRAEVVELVVYLYKANSSRGAERVAHAWESSCAATGTSSHSKTTACFQKGSPCEIPQVHLR